MNHVLPRRVRALGLLMAAVASLAIVSAVAPSATAGGGAAVAVPPTPTGLPVAIEGLSPYVPPTGCDLRTRTGSAKLATLIQATYGNTYGLSRPCTSATTPSSEHFDGRAVDTFFNVRNASERAEASAVLTWLLAYDKAGNRYANARRLGVMYIIWNDKMWSSYRPAEGWRPYSTCADTPSSAYDTACHRNHIHLSLSWEGANGRTSFWTKTVAPVDWGPCRPADLNWSAGQATPNATRCQSYPVVKAPGGASTLLKQLVPRSGMVLRPGMSGPAVTTLQNAIGVSPATGTFASATTSRLKTWQTTHGLGATGIAYPSTWRALLAANGMH
ncbi:peptidoglycan-binding protein [Terrabacter sp. Ter38]|uniref:peptidoglycan-binding domain-containing protein n=1 Tax=Terrabacter sp. Ter38 TaxID=2926030 RepID=UPI0021187E57|nr:peptidoglycan-binding domain-containing protein [Terrabacter sp. Ter38]